VEFPEFQAQDRRDYYEEDLPKVMLEAAKTTAPPDIKDLIERFQESFGHFHMASDPSDKGTTSIDLCFGKAFRDMSHQDLTQALEALQDLVKERMGMTAAFYYLPAPENAAADTLRVVCLPEVFVRFLQWSGVLRGQRSG
jgi:hypothetical protein